MAELKTTENDGDVIAFLNAVADPRRRAEGLAICALMEELVGEPPRLWGANIVGFGSYDYTYASGRSGRWMLSGFSPRKAALTLYVMDGFSGSEEIMGRLGKHTTGKSCLYIKRLSDIDPDALAALITGSVAAMRRKYPATP